MSKASTPPHLSENANALNAFARQEALIATLPLWFWRMDDAWRMTEVSDSISRVAGIEAADLVGIQVMNPDFGRQETEGGLGSYFEILRAGQSFGPFCYERIMLDGTRSVLMDSAIAMHDDKGRFIGFHGLTFQLSRAIEKAEATASLVYSLRSRADALEKELSHRNDALEKTNRLLTEIVEAMGEGLLVTSHSRFDDPDNKVLFSNPAYGAQFGLHPDDLRPGTSLTGLIAQLEARGDTVRRVSPMWMDEKGVVQPSVAVAQLISQNRTLYCKTTNRPSGGQVLVHTDVTQLEERSVALERALAQAGAASAAKSNFLAAMSHEFRTPMNGIVGMTDLLAATVLDDEQSALVDTIQSSAAALTSLISDILDFSKIEAGQETLLCEPVSLARLGRDVMALLRPMAQRKGLALHLDLGSDLPEAVLGDGLRLRQILLNLLGNAVKFTAKGHVRLALSGSAPVHIVIEDTGIGIAAGDLDHIHEPFRQLQTGLHRQFEGTGLGLAITQRLLTMMGGTREVVSRVGVGTTFRLSLPLVACAAAPIVQPSASTTAHDFTDLVILVAEDNRTNQLVMQKMLEKAGARVRLVASGTEAVAAAQDERIDLILMDVSMPGMDGFEASRAIRKHETEQALGRRPIIAVTGNAFDKDRELAAAAGMDDFLAKPVRLHDLLACLARHVAPTRLSADRRRA